MWSVVLIGISIVMVTVLMMVMRLLSFPSWWACLEAARFKCIKHSRLSQFVQFKVEVEIIHRNKTKGMEHTGRDKKEFLDFFAHFRRNNSSSSQRTKVKHVQKRLESRLLECLMDVIYEISTNCANIWIISTSMLLNLRSNPSWYICHHLQHHFYPRYSPKAPGWARLRNFPLCNRDSE